MAHDKISDSGGHELWPAFVAWLADERKHGLEISSPQEMERWWNCYTAGAAAEFQLLAVGLEDAGKAAEWAGLTDAERWSRIKSAMA